VNNNRTQNTSQKSLRLRNRFETTRPKRMRPRSRPRSRLRPKPRLTSGLNTLTSLVLRLCRLSS